MRHLNGGSGSGHHMALELESGKPKEQRIGIPLSSCKPALAQQSIVTMTEKATKEGYMKLFRTAYELAMNPMFSLSQCRTLVKVQRKNGVDLLMAMIALLLQRNLSITSLTLSLKKLLQLLLAAILFPF